MDGVVGNRPRTPAADAAEFLTSRAGNTGFFDARPVALGTTDGR